MTKKHEAYDFLMGLQKNLKDNLAPLDELKKDVEGRWKKPETEKSPQEKLGRSRENLFLYHHALPIIAEHIKSVKGFDSAEVLRGEYYAKFSSLLSANSSRRRGHPFGKAYPGENNHTTMGKWRSTPKSSYPLNESYPDLALVRPFPFSIVFDAKFFNEGKLADAEQALVAGVYEVVYYRGLPNGLEKPGEEECGYDYGCLLAYDASEDGNLKKVWKDVATTTKSLFWDDANVFVMIL